MTASDRRLGLLDLALITLPLVGLLVFGVSRAVHIEDDDPDVGTFIVLTETVPSEPPPDIFACCDEGATCDGDFTCGFDDTIDGLTRPVVPDCYGRPDREACLEHRLGEQVDAYLTGTEVSHRPIPYRR